MPDVPKDLPALFQQWGQLQADIGLIRQLARLLVLTNQGETIIKTSPNAENAILDLRNIVPTDPLTTIGDILHRNAENLNARLGIGSLGQVPTVGAAGVLEYQTPSVGGGGGGPTLFTKVADNWNMTIPDNTFTAVVFHIVVANAGGVFNGTDTFTFTEGLWLLQANVAWVALPVAAAERAIHFEVGGPTAAGWDEDNAEYLIRTFTPLNDATQPSQSMSTFFNAQNGDTVRLLVMQSSGGDEDLGWVRMSAVRLGARADV